MVLTCCVYFVLLLLWAALSRCSVESLLLIIYVAGACPLVCCLRYMLLTPQHVWTVYVGPRRLFPTSKTKGARVEVTATVGIPRLLLVSTSRVGLGTMYMYGCVGLIASVIILVYMCYRIPERKDSVML